MFEYLKGTTATGAGCMALSSVGAFLFGFDNGWWGTLLGAPRFLKDYGSCHVIDGTEVCELSSSQLSAGSAVQSVGIMIGCVVAVYLNDWLGRRKALAVTGIISIVGALIEILSAFGSSTRFSQFVVGKAICALSMGLAANIVPIYLSETSTGAARGFAVSIYQNVQILGSIVASGTVYGSSSRNSSACYYIPMGVQFIAPLTMIAGTPFLPESPRWLVRKGRCQEAAAAAERLFGAPSGIFDSASYIATIQQAVNEDLVAQTPIGWLDIFRGHVRRRLLIAVGIQCLQQAQGSTFINNYIVLYLNDAGITNVFPVIMGMFCLYWVAALTGHFFPDRFGRRPILISTSIACGISLIIIAIMSTVIQPTTNATQRGSIALIFLWEVAFGIQAPLVWITTAEAAPSRNRERVLAIAVFCGFAVSLIVASASPYIRNEGYGGLGSKIGFIYGSFSIITAAWVFFTVPEMKGFTLEQLDCLYGEAIPTRKFKGYKFSEQINPGNTAPPSDYLQKKQDIAETTEHKR